MLLLLLPLTNPKLKPMLGGCALDFRAMENLELELLFYLGLKTEVTQAK